MSTLGQTSQPIFQADEDDDSSFVYMLNGEVILPTRHNHTNNNHDNSVHNNIDNDNDNTHVVPSRIIMTHPTNINAVTNTNTVDDNNDNNYGDQQQHHQGTTTTTDDNLLLIQSGVCAMPGISTTATAATTTTTVPVSPTTTESLSSGRLPNPATTAAEELTPRTNNSSMS
eukprot:CAMPEP_0202451474 /NCGR_PEP_ID=MMETSP1360-20130828/9900_1 /ASSEMBLY_ACC=CAM_ASM_000848 /TAXON_ID=515479 /ORGANISM="Licmophora paradoxa, Strain CCMP2313" /LENGTH=170 /DNA_ID=CAMNT_0049070051 /DNA_START=39 /DNA_END=551 /DNA_ORIENTATION=+